jgi:hypothetical protein
VQNIGWTIVPKSQPTRKAPRGSPRSPYYEGQCVDCPTGYAPDTTLTKCGEAVALLAHVAQLGAVMAITLCTLYLLAVCFSIIQRPAVTRQQCSGSDCIQLALASDSFAESIQEHLIAQGVKLVERPCRSVALLAGSLLAPL